MPDLFNSLSDISSTYTVFETDQVLTAKQLNSISRYLDAQTRLSRIDLIGVGLVCGLQLKFDSTQVLISRGVAISSDGDLMKLPDDRRYDQYKRYDETMPVYPPLYKDADTLVEAYELLEQGVVDSKAQALTAFETATGRRFSDWVVMLLMESYIKDNDLCSSTGCDNLGQTYVARLKPLLIAKNEVERFKARIKTPRSAAMRLKPLAIGRVALSASISNDEQFFGRYAAASKALLNELKEVMPGLWREADFLLRDRFKNDPAPGWISRLEQNLEQHGDNVNAQYFYDFLKDVAETWNALREALLADASFCNPAPDSFPKHILLGDLVAGDDAEENRTVFYPARTHAPKNGLQHSVFLAEKLAELINGFSIPNAGTIRVTPSFTASRSLEERAIPWYYPVNASSRLLRRWNYHYHRQHRDGDNYSYHASRYGAQGAALDPLGYSIDRHDFFRIEGHLGQAARTVFNTLKQLIEDHNLPFAVATILLGQNTDDLVFRPGSGYTDLKRLHGMFRQDLAYRLDDVAQFSRNYKNRIDQAIDSGIVQNDVKGNDGSPVKVIAENKNSSVVQKAANAKQKLDGDYQHYLSNQSWRQDVNDVMKEASQFRYELGKVSKTESITPFDSLIANSQSDWLNWLDILIKDKDEQADEKNLFSRYIGQYPGLEHSAGVIRGGTFVIVYNAEGRVIGDLMLSHYVTDAVEPEAPEPPLLRPELPRDWFLDYGVQIIPSLDNVIQQELTGFKLNLDLELEDKLKVTSAETVGTVFNVIKPTEFTIDPGKVKEVGMAGRNADDVILQGYMDKVRSTRMQIQEFDKALQDSTLPAEEKTLLEKQKSQAEKELGENITGMTEYMSVMKTPVTENSEGAIALNEINAGLATIKNNSALHNATVVKLNDIQASTSNPALASNLGNIINVNR